MTVTSVLTRTAMRQVVIDDVTDVAEDVVALVLRPSGGGRFSRWTPGAHIDVALPSGLVRQYSLCSDPDDLDSQRIAVRLDRGGRGGSAELHEVAASGLTLTVSEPRNTFPLGDADAYHLIAGGIGITPILTMARRLDANQVPVRLTYLGRNRASMAFLDELADLSAVAVTVIESDRTGRPDVPSLLADETVYACGPGSLLDDLAVACPADRLHVERFGVGEIAGAAFTVELARSGFTVAVAEDVTILDAVRESGVDADSSCELGICGTCETRVLAGEVDHRDDILTDSERASGDTMMICVSRCRGTRLVLDL